jgi:DNA-binding winged helix-turn-helix (wHTH) protein/tetratricopeptide (TPR) repeat protein
MMQRFRFGEWLVDPAANSIEMAAERRALEPRMMKVLVALCTARGAILSADALLTQCWGSTLSGESPLHKTIAQLRRALGDSASAPQYIETVRLRGYRTVAPLDFSVAGMEERRRWQSGSPFRGLLAFDAAHADVFFGRDDVTRRLVDATLAQVHTGLALVLVLGPSGSGKTSVLQAGLLPALVSGRHLAAPLLLASTALDLVDQGEQTLFSALAGTLLDLQWGDRWAFAGENAASLGNRLEHGCESVIDELDAMLAPHRKDGPDGAQLRFGLFIDRFEALFNAARIDEAARRAFLHTLELLARSNCVLLVLACRNDFYPSIAQYPLLTEGKRHGAHFDLDPPGAGDIAQMIRGPAEAARLRFGTDPASGARLDDVLCASAVGRPDALPLLQYCLEELYRLRADGNELSFESFRQLGDLEGAIGQRAEEVVLGLAPAQRAALPHIMSLIVVLSSDGVNVSSQRAPWSSLRDEPAREAAAALVESRLFVSDLAGDVPVFGIAHDAILRRWTRMTEWIAAHRDALATRGRLAQHASRWRDERRIPDFLLPRGKLLNEATELQAAGTWSLTTDETALIAMSLRRRQQRDRGRLFALSLIVVLAILAAILGASALMAKRASEERRMEAENLLDFMLGDFSEQLRPLGRLDLLGSVSDKALGYLSGSDGADLSAAALTLRAKGLQTLAEVSRSRGDAKQALSALAQARAILMRQLSLTPNGPQVLKNLGANAYWVARIHKDRSDWHAAEIALRDYVKYADQLNLLEPDNPEWWVEQSYAHNNLGSLAQTRGQPKAAAAEFAASIALKRRALERTPASPSLAAELADSYSWLATAHESLGELALAEGLYGQQMQLVRQLRQRFPADSMWTYLEVLALQHRAVVALALGKDQQALRDYETAKQLFLPLAESDKTNRQWQGELISLEQERLQVAARGLGVRALLPSLIEVNRTWQAILTLDPGNALWVRRQAQARARTGAWLLESGQAEAGRHENAIALTDLQRLYASDPGNLRVRLALAEVSLLSATIAREDNNGKMAKLHCGKAYGIISPEAASTFDYKILESAVRASLCLGNTAIADIALKRLADIGYRDATFIRSLSYVNKENHVGNYEESGTPGHNFRARP